MGNFFTNIGDKDVTELYQRLRIARIQSVDTSKAIANLEWLDKTGGRLDIPLCMPFCEQGWGIYAMPKKDTIVLCEMRPYEYPIIIAYLPANYGGPMSNWNNFKMISSFPNGFDSGEVIIRNLIDKAKCNADDCKKVSTLAEWAANSYSDDSITKIQMEHCPICNVPAIEYDKSGTITKINKIQLGILIYMQKDGKLSIKLNDGLKETDNTFSDGSLIDIEFDEHSNLEIKGIDTLTQKSKNNTVNVTETILTECKDMVENISNSKSVDCPDIKFGDTNAATLVIASKLVTAMASLITQLNSHTHLSAAPGVPTGPASGSIPPITFANIVQSAVETTKTKAS